MSRVDMRLKQCTSLLVHIPHARTALEACPFALSNIFSAWHFSSSLLHQAKLLSASCTPRTKSCDCCSFSKGLNLCIGSPLESRVAAKSWIEPLLTSNSHWPYSMPLSLKRRSRDHAVVYQGKASAGTLNILLHRKKSYFMSKPYL